MSVALSDVDGDGDQDLHWIESDQLRIALGRGDGTFGPPSSRPVPLNARNLRIADVNGDGRGDLAYSTPAPSPAPDQIQIALADGAGSYGPPQAHAGAHPLHHIDLVDLDGDGRRDLVSVASDELVVSMNTGSSFAAPTRYVLADAARGQAAFGDLTGDGRPDAVLPALTGLIVVPNLGNGTFGTSQTYSLAGSWAAAIGDLDEDGDQDVIASTFSGTNTIGVMRNDGQGSLGAIETYAAVAHDRQIETLRLLDVDADGNLDVGAASGGLIASLLLGTGTGTVGQPLALAGASITWYMEFAHLDDDGRPDLVLASTNTIVPLLNHGMPGLFEMRQRERFVTNAAGGTAAHLLDLDRDGTLDLIGTINWTPTDLYTRRGLGGGAFAMPSVMVTSMPGGARPLLGDMNNDGHRDVVLTGYRMQPLLAPGDGTLVAVAPPVVAGDYESELADIDGDGFRDVVFARAANGTAAEVSYMRGLGDGTLAPPVAAFWTGIREPVLAVLDENVDGALDLVIYHFADTQPTRTLIRGLGGGAFAAPIDVPVDYMPYSATSRDINADGTPDVIGVDGAGVFVHVGSPSGLAPAQRSPWPPLTRSELAFADFDGDGHLDIAGTTELTIAVARGRGDGTFGEPVRYAAGAVSPGSVVTTGDVDEDGYVDIVVNNELGDALSILRGRCH